MVYQYSLINHCSEVNQYEAISLGMREHYEALNREQTKANTSNTEPDITLYPKTKHTTSNTKASINTLSDKRSEPRVPRRRCGPRRDTSRVCLRRARARRGCPVEHIMIMKTIMIVTVMIIVIHYIYIYTYYISISISISLYISLSICIYIYIYICVRGDPKGVSLLGVSNFMAFPRTIANYFP